MNSLSDGEWVRGLQKKIVSTFNRHAKSSGVLTLIEYQSLREKGSWVFFLRPFLPLESLLFLEKGGLAFPTPRL